MKYFLPLAILFTMCHTKTPKSYQSFEEYPTYPSENLWTNYSPQQTTFKLWSPTAESVLIHFYADGNGGKRIESLSLREEKPGLWQLEVYKDLNGAYYTFQVQINGEWRAETPGIYAQAVGVNGDRAMVVDLSETNPENWKTDKGPSLNSPNEAIIYECHVRDLTISDNAGSSYSGKYLGLSESGTKGPEQIATGIDHMIELGITHVHLLPSFDHFSIDETRLDIPQYNWGYDPKNYNVPEGSYSTDPYRAEVRIREFKQMVKNFHDAGIGVILDVVYNHTGSSPANANFDREAPGYYYRQKEDGSYSDASACGNETASDREMMRKFIVESVAYWAEEYHLDGFRFDLMGIHDVTTMNAVADRLESINPDAFVYGEGWTAGASPLPDEEKALKANTYKMPKVSAFSDDIRDGIKGWVFDEKSLGFVNGGEGMEASIKFGVVGSIGHEEVNYPAVNYSDTVWSLNPWQAVSYVSCHDNQTLYDKLKTSREDASEEEIIAMDKLAIGIVLTSQGIPFIHAGAEMLRTKGGEHNSYNKPDSINQIDWNWKIEHHEVFDYYKDLIHLRKNHPAFSMPTGDMVREKLTFVESKPGLIGFKIKDHANDDSWRNILVYYNANTSAETIPIEGDWSLAVLGGKVDEKGWTHRKDKVIIPPFSLFVAFQD